MYPIKDFLEIGKLAKAQTHRNLTLFPHLAPSPDTRATSHRRRPCRRGQ